VMSEGKMGRRNRLLLAVLKAEFQRRRMLESVRGDVKGQCIVTEQEDEQ